ncbi:hypothetical protein EJ065_5694 [Corallococcus coralloides]|uniref:Lipoprotein n=1 Tax=Corallococcus coralloides TaxID=184914 RepID=A0A410RZ47_CORCK|nr:hypothetical protein [Corallococcus coralloides]QAT87227.1 hypothetical protein EJ065_5694 [Corallococcus coralloides]
MQVAIITVASLLSVTAAAQTCPTKTRGVWADERAYLVTAARNAGLAELEVVPPKASELAVQTKVTARQPPWAGYFMPSSSGGALSRRFNEVVESACPTDGREWTLQSAVARCPENTPCDNHLSPVEKFALITKMNPIDARRLVEFECANRGDGYGSKRDLSLGDGYCNGVRAASLLYREPEKTVTHAVHGRQVVWTPWDSKALLSLASMTVKGYAMVPNNMHKEDMSPVSFDVAVFKVFAAGVPMVIDGDGGRECKKPENSEPYWYHGLSNENVLQAERSCRPLRPVANGIGTHDCSVRLLTLGESEEQMRSGKSREVVAQCLAAPSMRAAAQRCEPRKIHLAIREFTYQLDVGPDGQVTDGRWTSKKFPSIVWFPSGGMDAKKANPHLDEQALCAVVDCTRAP